MRSSGTLCETLFSHSASCSSCEAVPQLLLTICNELAACACHACKAGFARAVLKVYVQWLQCLRDAAMHGTAALHGTWVHRHGLRAVQCSITYIAADLRCPLKHATIVSHLGSAINEVLKGPSATPKIHCPPLLHGNSKPYAMGL